jgi:phosphoribosylformimino-5-aminoimidazole carboxamide ribotide isomerase
LKIIPVIDILNGTVVHAIKGQRNTYQPLKSKLCNSAEPLDVALTFEACGFEELYVADLDAIMGKGENLAVLEQMAKKTGLRLMVDAGVSNLNQAQQLFCCGVSKIVVGTETLRSLDFVKLAVDCLGSDRVVVSVDLKAGQVLSRCQSIRSMTALELSRELQNVGVIELIMLDLARVGSGEGVDFSFLGNLLTTVEMRVLVGGGVRGIDDLLLLRDMGVYGVLVATSLHSQKTSLDELRREGLIGSSAN